MLRKAVNRFKQYPLGDKIFLIVMSAIIIFCVSFTTKTVVESYNGTNNPHLVLQKTPAKVKRYRAYEKSVHHDNSGLAPLNSRQKRVFIYIPNDITRRATIDALDTWNQYNIVTFTYTVVNKKSDIPNSENIIRITEFDKMNTGTLGVTQQYFDGTGTMASGAEIKLNSKKLIHKWLHSEPDIAAGNSCIKAVAEHELGHAMGLYHRTDKPSVMYPYNGKYLIQQTDIKNLKRIYD